MPWLALIGLRVSSERAFHSQTFLHLLSHPERRDERNADAAKKRKANTRDAGASASVPPPKRRAPPRLTPEHESARQAAAAAAGVAVRERDAQARECSQLQSLAEATRQEADATAARASRIEQQLAAQLCEGAKSRGQAADRIAVLTLQVHTDGAPPL